MTHSFFRKYSPDKGDFGLRDLKYAQARLTLLHAFLDDLAVTPVDEIRIKDLCKKAEVSEPSFYNYFPRKDDLFLYFISLWSVDVQLHIRHRIPAENPGIQTIREIFRYSAERISTSSRIMKEILSYQARTDTSLRIQEIRPVTDAEKSLAFGAADDLYSLPDQGLKPLLTEHITAAVKNGELPCSTGIPEFTLLTASVFFGVPVIVLHQDAENLNRYYQMCLNILFNNQI